MATATTAFDDLRIACGNDTELIAINVYELFKSKKASKAIAAQYLAAAIDSKAAADGFDAPAFKAGLPIYVASAILYACNSKYPAPNGEEVGDALQAAIE